ncbi:hypothetical protein Tco_0388471, partial [Tanacetum coccineum]
SRAAGIRQRDAVRHLGHETEMPDLYGFADILDATTGRQMTRELRYGITDTWDDLVGAIQEIAPTTLEGVHQRVIELATTVDQEDEIIYSQLDDARGDMGDEESSDDDDDAEEEHLAPADPAAVAYSADHDPYLAYRV